MRVRAQTIRIPHLSNYRVRIRIATDKEIVAGFQGCCVRDGRFSSTIYARRNASPFVVAHEIMHVLRNICLDFHMDHDNENEHMAYLMQWLLGTAFNCEWIPDKESRK